MPAQPKVLKFVLVGDGGVGKSSIMNRFVSGQFDSQSYHTIGVEFLTKNITVDDKLYTLQIWDTAGQERFKSLRTPFYRGADCCLLTYSVDDALSFHNLAMWRSEFLYYADIQDSNFPFMVLGNKLDVDSNKKEVDKREAEAWCGEKNFCHIETSAKDATNVAECFARAVRETVRKQMQYGDASFSNLSSGSPSVNLRTIAASANNRAGCC